MTDGFNLEELEDHLTGTPTKVRVVYGTSYDVQINSTDLTLTTSVAAGAAVGTVNDVLSKTGALATFKEIEAALREKGHAPSEGYSISITDVNGNETLASTDLDDALQTDVHDGDIIAVIGKVSGRAE